MIESVILGTTTPEAAAKTAQADAVKLLYN
jgi:hypothetical protein